MRMVVAKAGQHTAALEVNYPRFGAGERHHLAFLANGEESTLGDGDGGRVGIAAVEGRETAVAKNEVGDHRAGLLLGIGAGAAQRQGSGGRTEEVAAGRH